MLLIRNSTCVWVLSKSMEVEGTWRAFEQERRTTAEKVVCQTTAVREERGLSREQTQGRRPRRGVDCLFVSLLLERTTPRPSPHHTHTRTHTLYIHTRIYTQRKLICQPANEGFLWLRSTANTRLQTLLFFSFFSVLSFFKLSSFPLLSHSDFTVSYILSCPLSIIVSSPHVWSPHICLLLLTPRLLSSPVS